MILAIAGIILKVILVVILIGIMVLALLAINYSVLMHTQHPRDDSEERLRHELEHSDLVIPRESVFHDFLARDFRKSHHSNKHTSQKRTV